MTKGAVGFLAFCVGAVAGYAIGVRLVKETYEQKYLMDVRAVKERLRSCQTGEGTAEEPEEEPAQPEETEGKAVERMDYRARVRDMGYDTIESKPDPDEDLRPRVISPDEFGEMEGYEVISLTYYDDGVLTDTKDLPMGDDDIEEQIGKESLNHFGEYEDDSVFVRNDRLKTDFEILKDMRSYADVLQDMPYLRQ